MNKTGDVLMPKDKTLLHKIHKMKQKQPYGVMPRDLAPGTKRNLLMYGLYKLQKLDYIELIYDAGGSIRDIRVLML